MGDVYRSEDGRVSVIDSQGKQRFIPEEHLDEAERVLGLRTETQDEAIARLTTAKYDSGLATESAAALSGFLSGALPIVGPAVARHLAPSNWDLEKLQEANRKSAIVGEVLGTIMPGGLGGKAIVGAGKLAQKGASALAARAGVTAAESLAGKAVQATGRSVVRNAAMGAAGGGLQGANDALYGNEDLADVITRGAEGAAYGGVTGAVAGPVVDILGVGVKRAAEGASSVSKRLKNIDRLRGDRKAAETSSATFDAAVEAEKTTAAAVLKADVEAIEQGVVAGRFTRQRADELIKSARERLDDALIKADDVLTSGPAKAARAELKTKTADFLRERTVVANFLGGKVGAARMAAVGAIAGAGMKMIDTVLPGAGWAGGALFGQKAFEVISKRRVNELLRKLGGTGANDIDRKYVAQFLDIQKNMRSAYAPKLVGKSGAPFAELKAGEWLTEKLSRADGLNDAVIALSGSPKAQALGEMAQFLATRSARAAAVEEMSSDDRVSLARAVHDIEPGDTFDLTAAASAAGASPTEIAQINNATMAAIDKLKQTSPVQPGSPVTRPSRLKMRKWESRVAATQDPDAVVGRIVTGRATADEIDQFVTAYPEDAAALQKWAKMQRDAHRAAGKRTTREQESIWNLLVDGRRGGRHAQALQQNFQQQGANRQKQRNVAADKAAKAASAADSLSTRMSATY